MKHSARLPLVVLGALAFAACGENRSTSHVADQVNPVGSDQQLTVTISAPSARQLPDAPELHAQIEALCISGPTCPNGETQLNLVDAATIPAGSSTARTAPIAATSTYRVDIGFFGSNGQRLTSVYYGANNITGTVGTSPATASVELRRIDVNHMVITRADGSTYTSRGNATVAFGDGYNIGTIPTGYGVDVIGNCQNCKYTVTVTATGEDGPKTYTSTLDFTTGH